MGVLVLAISTHHTQQTSAWPKQGLFSWLISAFKFIYIIKTKSVILKTV